MPSWRWLRMLGNLIRDKGREGRRGYTLPKLDVEETSLDEVLPKKILRKERPRLAEVDEPTVIRHYTNLSRQNWGIDTNFYPLGSCTMKHNPRANPATASMANFKAVEVGLDEHGCVDVDELREMVDGTTAALMITNPNTCGVFERNIKEISDVLHEAGAFLYMDGANMNANLGRMRAAAAGVDVMHFNLHKTFSTPPGGGGPGSGAIACSEALAPFRPDPVVEKEGDTYTFARPEKCIGRVAAFHGNFGQVLRAWNYIKMHGPELKDVTDMAVLNANYVRAKLGGTYRVPYDELCKHEVVVQPPKGKKALDIAKGLIDHGYHPPTIYFPLVVKEAMLIEPTENESKETLDDFVGAMLELAEAKPEDLDEAPTQAPTRRLDEARAARQLKARW